MAELLAANQITIAKVLDGEAGPQGETGADGYSPTVTTGTSSDGSTTVTVTNKDGSTTTTLVDGKARADIDNLEIGGRNLVTNSVNLSDFSIESSTHTTRTITDDYCIVNRLVNANSSSSHYGIYKDIPVTAGEEYTVSCTVKEITGRMRLGLGYDTSKWTGLGVWDLSVGRFSRTVTAPSSATFIRIYIAGNDGVNGGSVTVSNIKLEKGNRATDWTPAPEDVDAGIANAQTQADKAYTKAKDVELTKIDRFGTNASMKWDGNILKIEAIDPETNVPYAVEIGGNGIEFKYDNEAVAMINQDQLVIDKTVVLTEMQVNRYWTWRTRDNNNLCLQWIGGSN